MNSIPQRATDQTIFRDDIYALIDILNRQQWRQTLRELEQMEPALAEYVRNSGKTVAMTLSACGCTAEGIRTMEQFVLHVLVVTAMAVRNGSRKLMDDFLPEDGASGSDAETKS